MAGHVATEGIVTLSWETEAQGTQTPLLFELQQSGTLDFEDQVTRYRGSDRSSVLTGFPAGRAYFRVRAVSEEGAPGNWSEPRQVTFEYISMKVVWALMSVGTVVFTATCTAILTGHTRASRLGKIDWKA